MTFKEIKQMVARNLGLLSSQGEIIGNKVDESGIGAKVNQIYQEQIGQRLTTKYPEDFTQTTYPQNTNRTSFTVASVNGTTLTANEEVFTNSDEGFQIQNPTDEEYGTIATWTSATQIELSAEPTNDWTGDTMYILNNLFTFEGDATDLKEILRCDLKYDSSDDWKRAELLNPANLESLDEDQFSTAQPYFYMSNISQGDRKRRGVAILPYPDNYDGKIRLTYTAKPKALEGDTDEPDLDVAGISEVLINGATAWGFRVLNNPKRAAQYEEVDPDYRVVQPRGFANMLKSYRPRRSGFKRRSINNRYINQRRRYI